MRRCMFLPFAAALSLVLPPANAADEPKDPKKEKHTNKLAREISPYLLQHAHNPVDWYPWGTEAFAKAKKEGKLVFISIGYSSCHWCHVMEKESFSNPEVAKLMNQWFVCIKVDREERPDIDNVYITALHVFGQRGGWPLSMFLTADGKPIAGGTYWPPEDKEIDGEKIRGLKTILKAMQDYWKENPKAIEDQGDKIAKATAESLEGVGKIRPVVKLDRDLVTPVVDQLKEEFDKVYGGFGSAARQFRGTKFPTPPTLQLLQYEAGRAKTPDVDEMLKTTLDHMAQGGIYDHLGGGFHRYSTERTWTIPHFEKMLYDNAQLVELYSRAFTASKNPAYRRVVQETLDFVSRELTSKDGAFYSALDADSEGEEGKFYVWTTKELEDALGNPADVELIKQVYSKDGTPNFESKFYILCLAKPLADKAKEMKLAEADLEKKLAPLKKKLFDVRAKLPRPFLDTKILTAWNGEMIAGLAVAGQAFNQEKLPEGAVYIEAATKAADFLLKSLRTKDGRLFRTYGSRPGEAAEARLNAYLDDYAFLVHGLLSLHDSTGQKKWLDEAKALTEIMIKYHGDGERGGFFYTSNDHEKLFARAKDQYDGAQPSGNSVATRNLVRLWAKTGDDKYRDLAEKNIKTFTIQLKTSPSSMCTMAEALAMFLDVKKPEAPKE